MLIAYNTHKLAIENNLRTELLVERTMMLWRMLKKIVEQKLVRQRDDDEIVIAPSDLQGFCWVNLTKFVSASKRISPRMRNPAPVIRVSTPEPVMKWIPMPKYKSKKNYWSRVILSERAAAAVPELLKTLKDDEIKKAARVKAPLANISGG